MLKLFSFGKKSSTMTDEERGRRRFRLLLKKLQLTDEEIEKVVGEGIDCYDNLFYEEPIINSTGVNLFGPFVQFKLQYAVDYFKKEDTDLVPMEKMKKFTFIKFRKFVGRKCPFFRIYHELKLPPKDIAVLLSTDNNIVNFDELCEYYGTFAGVESDLEISNETKEKLQKFCQFVLCKLDGRIERFHYEHPWDMYDEFTIMEELYQDSENFMKMINSLCLGLVNVYNLVCKYYIYNYNVLTVYKEDFRTKQNHLYIEDDAQEILYQLTLFLEQKYRKARTNDPDDDEHYVDPVDDFRAWEFKQWRLQKGFLQE